jgi:5-methylcytosine-specific restriction endonuclease McrA
MKNPERLAKWLSSSSVGKVGPEHPRWNPDITDEERLQRRSTLENKTWTKAVFERDNYTCCCCGRRGGKLHAHHVYNYAQHRDLRFVVENGVTMCEFDHRMFHRRYGIKNNGYRQLEEFREARRKEVSTNELQERQASA